MVVHNFLFIDGKFSHPQRKMKLKKFIIKTSSHPIYPDIPLKVGEWICAKQDVPIPALFRIMAAGQTFDPGSVGGVFLDPAGLLSHH
jgi:hypothetical protein